MKSDRIGLLMIVVSLAVIAATGALWLQTQRAERLAGIRARGLQLTRVLAHMPAASLTPSRGGRSPLDLLLPAGGDTDLAYVAVVDPGGRPVIEVAASGVRTPPAPPSREPSEWYRERNLPGSVAGTTFLEFQAPRLVEGALSGYVRVGFLRPGRLPALADLPVLGALALPIFLMTPLVYLVVRRGVRPLQVAAEQLCGVVEDGLVREVRLDASGEVGQFIRNFNQVVQSANRRLGALSEERDGALTSARVLSYQKARIESVLQALPEGVLVLDEGGATTYANQKLGAMLGVDPATLRGSEPVAWCEDARLLALLCRQTRSHGPSSIGGSIEIASPVDAEHRIAVNAYPLFAPREGSEVFGTLVVFTDVTARFLAKQARKELIAQLSHELKTPLNVIGMYSEMLLEPEVEGADVRIEAGNVIHDEVERVTALINNMLSISRIELGSVQLHRQRTRLTDLLRDLFETAERSAAGEDLHFRLELPSDPGAVNVDKELLRIAVANLLSNATKYNRPGGEVVLGARTEDDELLIYVRDTGIGIRPRDRERIFEKFYRSEEAERGQRSGHGLGLPLAREIVQLHLGELRVESAPDAGTEFTIALRKTPALLKEAV